MEVNESNLLLAYSITQFASARDHLNALAASGVDVEKNMHSVQSFLTMNLRVWGKRMGVEWNDEDLDLLVPEVRDWLTPVHPQLDALLERLNGGRPDVAEAARS